MNVFRKRQPHPYAASSGSLAQLDQLAADAVQLAQRIKQTVAELRRQDERGTTDDTTS